MRSAPALVVLMLLSACRGEQPPAPADTKQAEAPAPAPKPPADAPPPPPRPHASPWSPSGYALNGTEPFWGGSVTGTTIRYMTPDDQFGDVIETRLAIGSGRETYTGSWRGSPFVLTLTRAPCSDGMSERIYVFTTQLSVGGERRRGCADPQ